MYNRALKSIIVNTYDGVDDYGYQLATISLTRSIEGTFNLYSHSPVEDVRYNDVEYTVLCQDKTISTNDKLVIDGVEYKVLFVNPFGRLTQVFLRH